MESELETRLKGQIGRLQNQVNNLVAQMRKLQWQLMNPGVYGYVKAKFPKLLEGVTGDLLGTTNQITVTNGSDCLISEDNVTLALPQDIHAGASPTFAGIQATNDLTITCGTNKTLALVETVWEDLKVAGLSVQVGAVAPNLDPFLGAGGLYAYTFDGSGATVEEVQITIQLPHTYKEDTAIYPHVHWAPTTANAGNVIWQLEYTWINIGGTFGASATVPTSASAAGGTAWVHKVADFSSIAGAGKDISSILVCRLFRDGAHASDSYADRAALLSFDLHYEVDTMGSRDTTTK